VTDLLPIAVYHEHPDWFRPLFKELDERAIPCVSLDAASYTYDPSARELPFSLVFNRASPSAHTRGRAQTTFFTLHWLKHVERTGVPVINGSECYALELSKAAQVDLLESLGLPYPKTRVINDPAQAVEATRGLRFPILAKANVGGSGAGIVRYESRADLSLAIAECRVDLGIDATALIQECAPLRSGRNTRVETLNGRFLYAINVYPPAGAFDLWPADACVTTGGVELVRGACASDAPKSGLRVEAAIPPAHIIEQVEKIARAASLDVGGIEYLMDDRDGRHYFYDINALSNFVADAPNVIGFDPHASLVDYLAARAGFSPAGVV